MISESIFLQAFDGKNSTTPVWFMRQAGRYLPQYRQLREKHTLQEMFDTPQLAAEVTCQPIGILKVDAAILFADILTLPSAMGADIHFDNQKGPQIAKLDVSKLHDAENLGNITETIKLINERLPKHIPLIGFAGSPFTVLTYLIEGGSSTQFRATSRFILEQPKAFHQLMELLTKNTIDYLNLQQQAGIKVFQLFDTWAGILTAEQFAEWVLPYVKKIFQNVQLPSIYYVRQCAHLLSLMDKSEADFLSVCHTVTIGDPWTLNQTSKGIQGNLHNILLYADQPTIKKELDLILKRSTNHAQYIFNLSHGVFQDTDVEKLKFITDYVHQFKR